MVKKRLFTAAIGGNPRQYTLEVLERLTQSNSPFVELEFPNGAFMLTASLLDDRDGLSHLAHRLEISQQQNRIREIADVDRSDHRRSKEPMLRHVHEGRHTSLSEVRQQLMQVQHEKRLFRN